MVAVLIADNGQVLPMAGHSYNFLPELKMNYLLMLKIKNNAKL